MGKAETLRIETGLPSVSTPRRSSTLPPHIANASRELDGKRVVVLDPRGSSGSLASQAQAVVQHGGAVRTITEESSFVSAISDEMASRAIGLLPASTSNETIARLLKLNSVQKGLALYIAGTIKRDKSITSLGDGNLSSAIVGKVRKLVK